MEEDLSEEEVKPKKRSSKPIKKVKEKRANSDDEGSDEGKGISGKLEKEKKTTMQNLLHD